MPVIFQKNGSDASILVYEIGESDQFYKQGIDFTEFDTQEYNSIANPLKKTQWLASRYWLKKMSGKTHRLDLVKTELGKPHITNSTFNFSISHSQNRIALILSPSRFVAIDIEWVQPKLTRLKHKFIHPEDFDSMDDIQALALIWSAKETIYKFYHNPTLYSFKEQIAITELKKNELSYRLAAPLDILDNKLYYNTIDRYVLTWIIG